MEPISILTFIGLVLTLLIIILKEFFSAKAEAKRRNEVFKMDQARFMGIVDKALVRMREDASRESRDAGDAEDRMDNDRHEGKF